MSAARARRSLRDPDAEERAYRAAVEATAAGLPPITQAARDQLTVLLQPERRPPAIQKPPTQRERQRRRLEAGYLVAGWTAPEEPVPPAPVEISAARSEERPRSSPDDGGWGWLPEISA